MTSLSPIQQQIFDKCVTNQSCVFIGGIAGSGKSFLVKHLHKHFNEVEGRECYLTSTSGVSAHNIGGVTLHSFGGLGVVSDGMDKSGLLDYVRRNGKATSRWKSVKVLIIDETSMLSGEVFEKLDYIARNIRQQPELPFGGIQLILTGDFYQLLPIKGEKLAFECWSNVIKSENCFEIKENFRQANDAEYREILTRLRFGNTTRVDIRRLKSRNVDTPNDNIIKIFSTNLQVNNENEAKVREFENRGVREYAYQVKYTHNDADLLEDLTKQFKTLDLETIKLRQGMRVMLLRNLDTEAGIVNGALGTILHFEVEPEVAVKCDYSEFDYEDELQEDKPTPPQNENGSKDVVFDIR